MNAKPLEVLAGELLRARGLRLAVAESCTGGLIGHRLTNVPGSSTYYMGGITAYAYEAKVRLLGVRWETLEKHGAVSEEVVLEMARGVRKALAADIGISVSGIAGPGGGTPDKPVGLTWVGLSAEDVDRAWRSIWPGSRLEVKEQSAQATLQALVDYLSGLSGEAGSAEGGQDESYAKRTMTSAVEIIARFDAPGIVYPQSFTWQGQPYSLDSIGRRWLEGADEHILVMDATGRVFELIFSRLQSAWRLKTISGRGEPT
ncbi:MAG TPA: CinA family protein [Anaerolineales bacterium]|nr:CinA family protein [Anaerolineales bacterium]